MKKRKKKEKYKLEMNDDIERIISMSLEFYTSLTAQAIDLLQRKPTLSIHLQINTIVKLRKNVKKLKRLKLKFELYKEYGYESITCKENTYRLLDFASKTGVKKLL